MTYDTPGVEPFVLTVIGDRNLSADVDRVIAAVGARAEASQAPSRRAWRAAAAVVLDQDGARVCVQSDVRRRDGIVVVTPTAPPAEVWASAVDVGAQYVCVLPGQESELVRHLAGAVEIGALAGGSGRVIGVVAGCGGAGASVFAAVLAQCAGDALLVDVDPCAGGIDLLLDAAEVPGVRWPDLGVHRGRLGWTAVREVLPRQHGVSFLSATRSFHDIEPGALAAVLDAGRRGGVTVVCDLPRQLTPAAVCGLEQADLVVVVTRCDVRGVAGAATMASVLTTVNPTVGLVVRGPSPGGLLAREAAAAAGAPLLAAMRPEPQLAQRLEQGRLRLARRSPLVAAARKVLDIADRNTTGRAA